MVTQKKTAKLTNYSVRNIFSDVSENAQKKYYRSTTILNVRKDGKVAMIGDGQISLGNTVFKTNANKIRKI